MSGGAYEHTAAWNTNATSYINNGNSFATTGGASTKYATAYYGVKNSSGVDIYTVCKIGDATKEVYVTSSIGWFDDTSVFAFSSAPFFLRGGEYITGLDRGIFNSNSGGGVKNSSRSFRAAISPSYY